MTTSVLTLQVEVLNAMRSNLIPNYIVPGLESYLVGKENCKVRMFQMTRDQEFHVSPHSHRFDFFSIVIRGSVRNHIYVPLLDDPANDWVPPNGFLYQVSEYIPAREGRPYQCSAIKQAYFERYTIKYSEREAYGMRSSQYHSIEFSKDAVVLFFEGPAKHEVSNFLEPVVSGKVIPTFTVPEWMYR